MLAYIYMHMHHRLEIVGACTVVVVVAMRFDSPVPPAQPRYVASVFGMPAEPRDLGGG